MTRDQFIYALTACGCLLKDGKTWYEHNELIKCFEDLGLFKLEPQTFKWCTDCREYDQEKHCCHRWSKVIRNTVEEMKQEYIEREVLDKIRAEITTCLKALDEIEKSGLNIYLPNEMSGRRLTYKQCLEFIEKYKTEIKTVANAEEFEAHPINENIAKGFEEFTKMMFKQGQAEGEKDE